MLEAMQEDYVRTARAKGAPEWQVLRSHVLRNALLPVVTILGMEIGGIVVFATAVIIVLNLVVDLAYAAIDPRIRLA